LICDDTLAETRFRLSAKHTSPFKSVWASVHSTTGSRGVRISGSNAGYAMFRGSVRILAAHSIRHFPLHFPLPCVTMCYHISTGVSKCQNKRMSGVDVSLMFSLGIRSSEWSAMKVPADSNARKSPKTPLNRQLCGTQNRSERVREEQTLLCRSPVVQRLA